LREQQAEEASLSDRLAPVSLSCASGLLTPGPSCGPPYQPKPFRGCSLSCNFWRYFLKRGAPGPYSTVRRVAFSVVRGFPLTVCNARFRRRAQSLPRAIAPVPLHSGAADARLTLGMQLTALEREKASKRRGNEPILVRGSSLPSDPRLVDASSARLAKRGANLMV
jgi:hypothetical protein